MKDGMPILGDGEWFSTLVAVRVSFGQTDGLGFSSENKAWITQSTSHHMIFNVPFDLGV